MPLPTFCEIRSTRTSSFELLNSHDNFEQQYKSYSTRDSQISYLNGLTTFLFNTNNRIKSIAEYQLILIKTPQETCLRLVYTYL